MSKKINEIGNKYDALTVIEASDIRSSDGRIQWLCKCDCGNTKLVTGKQLRNGNVKSCGCGIHKQQQEIGKRYGNLIVLSFAFHNTRGELLWNCKCDCGNIIQVKTSHLRSGHTRSCGCSRTPNLIGKKFGKLTVIKDTGLRQRNFKIWECQCDCGNIAYVPTGNLTTGNTSSCGCITSSIGEKNIEEWLNNNRIKYKKEYRINTGHRFDFALYDNFNNLVMFIEFDGEQHYFDRKGIWNNNDTLEDIQARDQIKNNYAIKNKIPLIRIPYYERDNICTQTIFNPKYFVYC